jgi:hypothetical protein
MPAIAPRDMIDHTFLRETEADCHCFCARIVGEIIEKDSELKCDPDPINFLVDGDTADDMYSCNQDLDFIEHDSFEFYSDTE